MGSCKAALSNLILSDKIQEGEDAFKSFSESILNFHPHYCLDVHSSPWCHHDKVMHPYEFLINKHLLLVGGRWKPIQIQAHISSRWIEVAF